MIRLLTLLFLLFFFSSASAQYRHILQPQPDEEIEKFKSLGVKIQFMQPTDENDSNYSASYIDESGHKILIQKPKEKSYIMYDNKGRFIRRLDSIQRRGNLLVGEYFADYNLAGKLSVFKTPNATSIFRYNAKDRKLEEQYVGIKGDTLSRFYWYDNKDRLIEEDFRDDKGKKERGQTFVYNKDGHVEKETITEIMPNGSMTFYGITYSYNKNGKITSRQIVIVDNYPGEKPDPGKKFFPVYRNRTINYEYDENGNNIKESLIDIEHPEVGYTVERHYDKDGLMILERSFNYKRKPLISNEFQYEFRKK